MGTDKNIYENGNSIMVYYDSLNKFEVSGEM